MSVKTAFVAAGVPAGIAARDAPLAEKAMREFGITTQPRASAFLAQVLHETMRLRYAEEIATGEAYEGRSDLGNNRPGDGRRFKGRGKIQLTGRGNYRWAGKQLGLDLVSRPQIAAQHEVGWRIAGLYWRSRGLNGLADKGAFETITKRINGGLNGYADRRAIWKITERHDCRPASPWRGFTANERRWCQEYDRLKHERRNLERRRELRQAMLAKRREIWREARPKNDGGDGRGWDHGNRRARYRALRQRTS